MKNYQKIKQDKRQLRHARVRAKIQGSNNIPRLSVYRSLKHINVQLIDDTKGITLASAKDTELKDAKGNKSERAFEVGKLIAQKAKDKNITKCVFDRSSYKYHGRVKSLAEGAREAGLNF